MNIPLNIDWQQILLHLFNFAILAGGLYILLYKPVKDFIAKRQAYYADMDTMAQEALAKAQAAQAEAEAQRDALEDELRLEKLRRQQAAQASIQRQLDDAKAQADQIITDARRSALRTKEKALADAQEQMKQLAVVAVEKLVMESSGDAFDQFLAIAEKEEAEND